MSTKTMSAAQMQEALLALIEQKMHGSSAAFAGGGVARAWKVSAAVTTIFACGLQQPRAQTRAGTP